MNKKILHMYILNNKGLKTDPRGTPIRESSKLLKDELILVLYFLLLRKLKTSLMDLQSAPYAVSFS